MNVFRPQARMVRAVVDEILPRFGLAFALDDEPREWTIHGLEGLGIDSHVQLHFVRHGHQILVGEYHCAD